MKSLLHQLMAGESLLRNLNKLILVFGLSLLCLIWSGVYYQIDNERQAELRSAIRDTANMARAFEEHTLRTINSADQAALFLKYQYEQAGRNIDIPRYVREGRFANLPFVLLGVIDEHGQFAVSNQVPFVPSNLKDREHFRAHLGADKENLFISKPVLGRSSGKWSIQMTRRANKPDGSLAGVVVVSVDPFYFTEFYSQVDMGKNSNVTLVGLDGIVRARQSGENSAVGQDLNGGMLMAEIVTGNRAGNYTEISSVDGVKRIHSFRVMNNYPLAVVVGVAEAEVLERLYERTVDYYWAAGLVSLVICIFSGWLLRLTRQQQKVAEERKHQIRFQKMIADISLAFITASSETVDEKINRTLQVVSEFFKVERSYFLSSMPGQANVSMTHEWCAAGIASRLTETQNCRVDYQIIGEERLAAIRAGEIVHLRDVENPLMQCDAAVCRMKPDSRINHLLIPIRVNHRIAGLWGFQSTKQPNQWQEEQLALLRIVANTLSEVLAKRELEQEIIQARDKAETANLAKSRFLANMSHEIRTPMNGILGFLQLLETTQLSEEQADFVHHIKLSSNILRNLINDVLDLSKIEAKKMELEQRPFHLHSAVEDILTPFTLGAYEKKLGLHLFIAANTPEQVVGDSVRLQQALSNLISNALKFTSKGEVQLEVALVGETKGEYQVEFVVRDSGIGMSADSLTNIFQPFTQADNSTTRKFGGTGLGLSITKSIIEMMQGNITAESREGAGSVFRFNAFFGKIAEAAPTKSDAAQPLKGKRLLVVEPNLVCRRIIEAYLAEQGVVVEFLADGAQTIAAFMNRKTGANYAAVLIDFTLPDMTAWDLVSVIRLVGLEPEVPILLLVPGVLKLQEKHESRLGEVNGYIDKPLRKRELWTALEQALVNVVQPVAVRVSPAEQKKADRHVMATSKNKVLVVEDNEINYKYLNNVLKRNGLASDWAATGLEALQLVDRNDYALIWMDCQMPVMDGLEATRRIRLLEEGGRHVPIIALTAHSLAGDEEKCLTAGMDGYIRKPFEVGQILEILQKYALIAATAAAGNPESRPRRKLLVVDDTLINTLLLCKALEPEYQVRVAHSGREALESLQTESLPDLIVLDIMMPEMNGYEVCTALKSQPETSAIPVIFLSAMESEQEQAYGMQLGAVDFITKPFSLPGIKAKIKQHLNGQIGASEPPVDVWQDDLTRIANRKRFNELLAMALVEAKAAERPLSMLLIDIDCFKNYNADYGNLAGDNCLWKISQILQKNMPRQQDVVARWGSDEFACILPNTDRQQAVAIGEKLRQAVAAMAITHGSSAVADVVTVSVGVASWQPGDPEDGAALVEVAGEVLAASRGGCHG